MNRPWWARGKLGKPIAVFRAPWKTNWPVAIHATVIMTVVFPIVLIGKGPFLKLIGVGLLGGLIVGMILIPATSLLHPIRVYRHGLIGFDRRGGGFSVGWEDIVQVEKSWCEGVPGFDVTVAGENRSFWLPGAIARDERFSRLLSNILPNAEHPLFECFASSENAESSTG